MKLFPASNKPGQYVDTETPCRGGDAAGKKVSSDPTYSGFTLIELLVVLGIMALALTVVPPMFGNVLENTRVKSASRELAAGLRTARSEAISKQREIALQLDVVRGLYTLDARQHDLELPGSAELVLTTAKSEQLSADEGMIRFFPDGSSTGGQVSIENRNQTYTVDVNWLTGQIRITP